MKRRQKKGIYCIEGNWSTNIRDKASVLPILTLLEKQGYCSHIYHDSATVEELEFYLAKWKGPLHKRYPILYLAFHGDSGCVFVGPKNRYSIEDLGNTLSGKCTGTVIHFGSCSTLNLDKRIIKTFLRKTGAIAAIGYKDEVDWIQSAACDLFVFEALQYDRLDTKGINKIYKSIKTEYGNLHKILGLTVIINDKGYFPRTRTK